jgi:hypothetical protein
MTLSTFLPGSMHSSLKTSVQGWEWKNKQILKKKSDNKTTSTHCFAQRKQWDGRRRRSKINRGGWRRRVEDKRLGFRAENERTNRSWRRKQITRQQTRTHCFARSKKIRCVKEAVENNGGGGGEEQKNKQSWRRKQRTRQHPPIALHGAKN